MTDAAFWDSSAIVPLCLQQKNSSEVRRLLRSYGITVWWSAPVEARSALSRELRDRNITPREHRESILKLEKIREDWIEVLPEVSLRSIAEELPDRYGLRAADALHLAAAYDWAMQRPAGRPFISGDKRLLDAAEKMGFRTIAV